jgi:hypothetical protein
MDMTKISTCGLLVLALCGSAAGCMPREPVAEPSVMRAPPRDPQDQSYLNPGPAPARGNAPSYLQNGPGSPGRDSQFGADLIPRIP